MQKLFIKNRHEQKIAVVVNENNNAKGLVFIMHGLGGFKDQDHIKSMEKVFADLGYSTVIFDTTNSNGESDGQYELATMENYYDDLEDVIAWSKKESWYKEPFFLVGHSIGGYSVIRFAEENPALVKGVIALAPVVSGKLSYEANEARGEIKDWQETGWKSRISISKPGVELRLPWSHMLERLKHDLLPKADKIIMPILIIVGEKDTSCPVGQQKILLGAIASENKKLVIIKDVAHDFRTEEELLKLKINIKEWLDQFNK